LIQTQNNGNKQFQNVKRTIRTNSGREVEIEVKFIREKNLFINFFLNKKNKLKFFFLNI
jgi:hypothetical protein